MFVINVAALTIEGFFQFYLPKCCLLALLLLYYYYCTYFSIVFCFSRLEAIKTEKLPQVLAVRHSDEEYDADEDRFDVLRDASSDEDDKEEKCCENMQLPDSLFQSPSPG